MKRLLLVASAALALAGCNDQYGSLSGRSAAPVPPQTLALMSTKGMFKSDPMLVRLYKKESELEVWKKGVDGEYAHLKTFPICRWSGQLGPKRKEGDRQAPEGFYSVTPGQMNPNSAYYLSFDTGYPNAYDRAHDGTGSALMVHGTCSSRGCYAMTDEGIAEIYALARESFSGGQKSFQFQSYPFRMTAENLAKFRKDPNMPFWQNLKEGSDTFEITKRETKVAVCGGRYAFNTVGGGCTPDPTLAPALAEKQANDRHEVAELVAKGTKPVRLVYADGGQHESFRNTALASLGGGESAFTILDSRPRRSVGDVSRPDALANGPVEIAMDDTPAPAARAVSAPRTAVAAAAPARKSPSLAAVVVAEARTAPARNLSTPVVLAKADEPVAAQKPAPVDARPFYERMIGNVFGRSSEPAAEPAAAEPAVAANDAAPVLTPPRRRSVAATPPASKPAAATPPARPQASQGAPQKHVDAAAVLSGPKASVGPLARN